MSRDDGKYSRLYWHVKDDEKFDGIRSDPATFGTWALLLMDSDAVWPSSPSLPRWVRKRHLDALVKALLIDLLPDDRYRIHGLDAERARRSEAARVGGLASGRSRTVERPYINRSTKTNLDEYETSTRRDEYSAREGLPNLDATAIRALEERTGHTASQAGDKQLNEYDRLIGDHGLTLTLEAFDSVRGGQRMTARQLVWGAVKVLEPFVDPKAVAKTERAAEADVAYRNRLAATQRRLAELRGEGA